MPSRETWATRLGFIVAAIGSAIGLGNIWQFPFKTASNGGAAFVVFYLVAVFLIGFPAMLAEFSLGRKTHRNAVDAFAELGHREWRVIGVLAIVIAFWIMSYYSVVGGWVIRYVVGSATGAYFGGAEAYFGQVSAGPTAVALQALFLLITIGIVALGIERGIEAATKLMVPSIVILMLALALWAFTLNGAGAGYEYFLSPEIGSLFENAGSAIPFAVGQAFFTLSLGMGIMITYSSYIGEDDNLPIDGSIIVVVNTLIGVLAGLVVFPILFAQGVDPNTEAAAAIFIAVASAFAELPAGGLLGVVFFGIVLIAALSSAISLTEVVVSYVNDNYDVLVVSTESGEHDVTRPAIASAIGLGIFVLGIPSAWDTAWLTWFDNLAYSLFLPVSVLLIAIYVGWVIGPSSLAELREGAGNLATFGPIWLWTVRLVVVGGVLLTLGFGIYDLLLAEEPAIVPPL